MNYEMLKQMIKRFTHYLEFVLASFIAVSVVIGMVDLVRYLIIIYTTNPYHSYDVIQKFLGHVLLLVVGVELVVMMVFHSPTSVIEVLLYAVARKLLIYNQGMIDFIIGIIAMAAIFAIRKFLFVDKHTNTHNQGFVISAAASIDTVNDLMKLSIPAELGNTIGGVISNIAHTTGSRLHEGAEFNVSNAMIRIIRMKEDVIEQVSIRIN